MPYRNENYNRRHNNSNYHNNNRYHGGGGGNNNTRRGPANYENEEEDFARRSSPERDDINNHSSYTRRSQAADLVPEPPVQKNNNNNNNNNNNEIGGGGNGDEYHERGQRRPMTSYDQSCGLRVGIVDHHYKMTEQDVYNEIDCFHLTNKVEAVFIEKTPMRKKIPKKEQQQQQEEGEGEKEKEQNQQQQQVEQDLNSLIQQTRSRRFGEGEQAGERGRGGGRGRGNRNNNNNNNNNNRRNQFNEDFEIDEDIDDFENNYQEGEDQQQQGGGINKKYWSSEEGRPVRDGQGRQIQWIRIFMSSSDIADLCACEFAYPSNSRDQPARAPLLLIVQRLPILDLVRMTPPPKAALELAAANNHPPPPEYHPGLSPSPLLQPFTRQEIPQVVVVETAEMIYVPFMTCELYHTTGVDDYFKQKTEQVKHRPPRRLLCKHFDPETGGVDGMCKFGSACCFVHVHRVAVERLIRITSFKTRLRLPPKAYELDRRPYHHHHHKKKRFFPGGEDGGGTGGDENSLFLEDDTNTTTNHVLQNLKGAVDQLQNQIGTWEWDRRSDTLIVRDLPTSVAQEQLEYMFSGCPGFISGKVRHSTSSIHSGQSFASGGGGNNNNNTTTNNNNSGDSQTRRYGVIRFSGKREAAVALAQTFNSGLSICFYGVLEDMRQLRVLEVLNQMKKREEEKLKRANRSAPSLLSLPATIPATSTTSATAATASTGTKKDQEGKEQNGEEEEEEEEEAEGDHHQRHRRNRELNVEEGEEQDDNEDEEDEETGGESNNNSNNVVIQKASDSDFPQLPSGWDWGYAKRTNRYFFFEKHAKKKTLWLHPTSQKSYSLGGHVMEHHQEQPVPNNNSSSFSSSTGTSGSSNNNNNSNNNQGREISPPRDDFDQKRKVVDVDQF